MAFEPFKTKVIEPIRLLSRRERIRKITEAHFNLFNLRSSDVCIDLLTDSGTSAMSEGQWSMLMLGDEAYAGSDSFERLEDAVKDVFGLPYVLPCHQGRSAELAFMSRTVEKGKIVLGNIHFDTTEAHILHQGGVPLNIPIDEIYKIRSSHPFKGNMDIDKLQKEISRYGTKRIALIILTVTCNSGGGQPVSMENIRQISRISNRYRIPLYLDAARSAENAYFIHSRERGYSRKSIKTILREMVSHVDGLLMSAKKDGLSNMGGLIALRDRKLFEDLKQKVILFDGYVTYGGMSGRDIETVAAGLREMTDIDYLAYRVGQVAHLAGRLTDAGIQVVEPPGGHAVYLDALHFCPHLKPNRFPGQALSIALYLEGGIRSCEIGPVLRGRDPRTGKNQFGPLDLVRLAIPRRVYSLEQLDYVAEVLIRLKKRHKGIRGASFKWEPRVMRHFTAEFELV